MADFPVFARHVGVWEGTYTVIDRSGRALDHHKSRLSCAIEGDTWSQTNRYTWEDGREEVRDFPAQWREGRIWFDTELISGWAAEVALDEFNRTLMLYWQRKNESDLYLYEMIQLSDCGRHRHRVWQWIRDGRIHMRTLIDEEKVSDSWEGY